MTVLTSVTSAYGRSRSTDDDRPSAGAGAGGGAGSRMRTAAEAMKLSAATTNTVRYAGRVPTLRATPPRAAPRPSPALTVDCRYARSLVRSAGPARPARRAWRAAARPLWQLPYRQAVRTNGTKEWTSRKARSDAAVATASGTATPRGPRRSASCPSGTATTEPTAQPAVRPNPICPGLSPTTREKYSADVT